MSALKLLCLAPLLATQLPAAQTAAPAPAAGARPTQVLTHFPPAPAPGVPSTPAPSPPAAPAPKKGLMIDAPVQKQTAKPGAEDVVFTFRISNPTSSPQAVLDVQTSCGCSVAKLPARPWIIAPGATGDLEIVVDVRGKSGELVKTATLQTEHGLEVLTLQISVPVDEFRARNLVLARADRQAVFKGECANCHVEPAKGKIGHALYQTACAICHDAPHRASFVPDLRALAAQPTPDHWRSLIVAGKPGTLMPGFSADMGGPLTTDQINSLVEYLSTQFVRSPAAAAPARAHE